MTKIRPAFYVCNPKTREVRPIAYKGVVGDLHTIYLDGKTSRDIPAEEVENWARVPASSVKKANGRYTLRTRLK